MIGTGALPRPLLFAQTGCRCEQVNSYDVCTYDADGYQTCTPVYVFSCTCDRTAAFWVRSGPSSFGPRALWRDRRSGQVVHVGAGLPGVSFRGHVLPTGHPFVLRSH